MLSLPTDPSETRSKPTHPYNKKGLFIVPNDSSPRSALSNGNMLEINSPEITDKLALCKIDSGIASSSSQQLSTTERSQKSLPEKQESDLPSNKGQLQPLVKKSLYKQLPTEEVDKIERKRSTERPLKASVELSCPICYGDFDEASIIQPLDCKHKFCKECVGMYIQRQIEEFNVLKIKCPQDHCTGIYGSLQLQAILDKDSYEKYQQKKLLKLRNRDFQLKYCPKPGCAKPFYPDSKSKTTKCSCGMIICNNCFTPKHKDKPCLEAAEGEYEIYIENTELKKCFMCKTVIEKQIGCAHMTCPVCDYEWCWNCGREWNAGHVTNCLNEWNPKPPKVLQDHQHLNLIDNFINSIFLLFEIIIFGLGSALGVALVWPCLMTEEFSLSLSKKIKTRAIRVGLAGLLALVTWPIVVVVYPFSAVIQEYGTCLKKKRWVKGTSAKFGFHNKVLRRANPLQAAFRRVQRRLSRNRNNQDREPQENAGPEDNNNRVEVAIVV